MIGLVTKAAKGECPWCHQRVTFVTIKTKIGRWRQMGGHDCVTTALSDLVDPGEDVLELSDESGA